MSGSTSNKLKALAAAAGSFLPVDAEGRIYGEYKSKLGKGSFNLQPPKPWEINGEDWDKVFGYQFIVYKKEPEPDDLTSTGGLLNKAGKALKNLVKSVGISILDEEYIYTLPIPPQNLTTRMVIASQATATMGGVVEETTNNVFWNISMSGTTGIAIGRGDDVEFSSNGISIDRTKMATTFRDKILSSNILSSALSGKTTLDQQIAAAGKLLSNPLDNLLGAATGGIKDIIQNGTYGKKKEEEMPEGRFKGSAVPSSTNGFTEIQEIQRFLYTYSKLKGLSPSEYFLAFRNYKTGQEWRCIVQDFQILQNAQSPLLYRYNIVLKCWNVQPVDSILKATANYDRFAPGGDLSSVNHISVLDRLIF